jgi:stage II sporulation protein D
MVVGGCREREVARRTVQMDAAERFWIRVLLVNNTTSCTVKVGSGFSIFNGEANIREVGVEGSGGPMQVSTYPGGISMGGHRIDGEEVIVSPDEPHIFELNGLAYRGKLKLVINAGDNSFDAINLVPLEPYLAGVLGAEMPHYWEPAALEAQAIAARTYCLHIKKRFGGNRKWDVRRSQANQVYLGVGAEAVQVWEAVNKTWGQVLVCKDSEGIERVFPAYYSSTCGGYTENSQRVFGDSFEALIGVSCPYCRDVARPGFFFWPMAEFDKRTVSSKLLERYPKLEQLGEIETIVAAGQSNYGDFSRLTSVKLVGSRGKSEFLRAEDFRLAIDPTGRKLRSTTFQIVDRGDKWAFLSGRGYGHGVGMCQCGAQAMARAGKRARAILSHYYPGSKIVSVYGNE